MDRPITVVIPYNERFTPRSYLKEAVESAKDQTIPTKVEVIEDEKGPAFGRNKGIKLAETQFVAFLDADDLWEPDKLERQRHAMSKTGAGASIEAPTSYTTPEIIRELLIGDLGSVTSSLLIDTQCVSARFREDFVRYEDQMFVTEVGLETEFAPIQECVRSRKHDRGMSNQGSVEQNLKATTQLYEEVSKVLPKRWPYRQEVLAVLGYNITRLNQRCQNYVESCRWGVKSLRSHGWQPKTAFLLFFLPAFYARDRL